MDQFEKEMLKKIAKFHRHDLPTIEGIYERVRSFDRVLIAIKAADLFNVTLNEAFRIVKG